MLLLLTTAVLTVSVSVRTIDPRRWHAQRVCSDLPSQTALPFSISISQKVCTSEAPALNAPFLDQLASWAQVVSCSSDLSLDLL